jgi:hypothetical protein
MGTSARVDGLSSRHQDGNALSTSRQQRDRAAEGPWNEQLASYQELLTIRDDLMIDGASEWRFVVSSS